MTKLFINYCKSAIGSRKVNKLFLSLFLLAIFFFKVPNFYLAPYVQNAFLTTQGFSRAIIILLTIYCVTKLLSNGCTILKEKENKIIISFMLLLFTVQSLSIVEAINMVSFLNRYKDIILGLCSFFVFYVFRKKYTPIIISLVLSTLFNGVFQFFLLFQKDLFLNLTTPFLYQNYARLLIANIDRGRIYVPTFDEAVIPLLFVPKIFQSIRTRILRLLSTTSIIFFAFASNFRSNIVVFTVATLGSFIVAGSVSARKVIFLFFSFIILIYFVNILVTSLVGFSFYDRLTFQSKLEDTDTVTSRLEQSRIGLAMGSTSIFGVGLGNYYDSLDVTKEVLVYSESRKIQIKETQIYIHNIFASLVAESGYPSLIIFLIILTLFVRQDIKTFKSNSQHKKAFSVAFWGLFCWGLFNPPVSGTYQLLFWGFRGILLR